MSLTLNDIRDWLKTMGVAEHYYTGRLENKKDKSLGVYQRARSGPPVAALGLNSSYDIKAVTLLIHWNRSPAETEKAALALWQALFGKAKVEIPEGSPIQYIQPDVPEPVAVDTDENGVYEYVIDLNIYYRR